MKRRCCLIAVCHFFTAVSLWASAPGFPDAFQSAFRQYLTGNDRAYSESVIKFYTDAVKKTAAKDHDHTDLAFYHQLTADALPGDDRGRIAAAVRSLRRRYGQTPAGGSLTYLAWRLARRRGQVGPAREYMDKLGIIRRWLMIGPFGNRGGAGLSTIYPPEKSLSANRAYPGKDGPVKPFATVPVGLAGMLRAGKILGEEKESVAYLITRVQSSAKQNAILNIGSSGSYRLWLNGRSLVQRRVKRECRALQDAVPVSLQQGANYIAVKLVQRSPRWGFWASISDAFGNAPAQTVCTPELKPSESYLYDFSQTAQTAVNLPAYLLPAAGASLDGLSGEALLRYAWVAMSRRRYGTERRLLRNALHKMSGRSGASLLERWLYARSLRSPGQTSAEKNENRRRGLLESMLRDLPGGARLYHNLAEYYFHTAGNRHRALSYSRRAVAANKHYIAGQVFLWRISAAMGHIDTVRYQIRGKLTDPAWRDHPRFLRSARRYLRRYLPRDRLSQLYKRQLNRRLYPPLLTSYADTLGGSGAEARRLLKRRLVYDPFHAGTYLRLHRMAAGEGDTGRALSWLNRGVEALPRSSRIHKAAFEYHYEQGDMNSAARSLRRALRADPNNPDLRRRLAFHNISRRETAGKTAVSFETPYDPSIAPLIKQARNEDWDRDTNISHDVLLRRVIIRVQNDGTAHEYHHLLFRVRNKQGIRRFRRFHTTYAKGEQKVRFLINRLHRRSGKTADGEIQNHRSDRGRGEYTAWHYTYVEPPRPDVGDLIEIAYRRSDTTQGMFGDYFGRRHFFHTSDMTPVKDSLFVVSVPTSIQLKYKTRNSQVKPTIRLDEKRSVYRWRLTDLPHLKEETAMPPYREIAPQVEISNYVKWDEFTQWWWNLIKDQFEATAEMRRTVRRLVQDKKTDRERVRAVYRFVADEIRYVAWEFGIHGYKPYKAADIFERRFGDCKDKSILLVSLLDIIGIEAYPVLLHSTQRRGREDLTVPLVNHFNHCIAYVPGLDGGTYLDATGRRSRIDEPLYSNLGAKALVVTQGRGKIKTLPRRPPGEDRLTRHCAVDLRTDGSARVKLTVTGRGFYAPGIRHKYVNKDKRREKVEKLLTRIFGATELISMSFHHMTDYHAEPYYVVTARVPRFVNTTSRGPTVPASLFIKDLSSLVARRRRQWDIVQNAATMTVDTLEYRLPSGQRWQTPPASVKIKRPFGTYRYDVKRQGTVLRVTSRFLFSARRIPVSRYESYRDFCVRMMETEKRRILINTGESP